MPTRAVVGQAEVYLQRQRHAGAQFLRVRSDATPAEIAVFEKIKAAAKHGPADYDDALTGKEVSKLFYQGVLFFGRDE